MILILTVSGLTGFPKGITSWQDVFIVKIKENEYASRSIAVINHKGKIIGYLERRNKYTNHQYAQMNNKFPFNATIGPVLNKTFWVLIDFSKKTSPKQLKQGKCARNTLQPPPL